MRIPLHSLASSLLAELCYSPTLILWPHAASAGMKCWSHKARRGDGALRDEWRADVGCPTLTGANTTAGEM